MNENWYERLLPRAASSQDPRTPLAVDYARVIHSSSFRRLAGKTQIHSGDSDIPRTRLTHSLEVSQIALGIAQRLQAQMIVAPIENADGLAPGIEALFADPFIWQIVGLCHDLGHPCGSHAGEEALNSCLPYEGNGQTLRILTRLESHTAEFGLNLTRRSLLGILKYPVSYSEASTGPTPPPRRGISGIPLIGPEHLPPKCFLDSEEPVVEWLFAGIDVDYAFIKAERMKSFDAQLMDLADDFAYSVADLDDAIALSMMKPDWLAADVPANAWKGFVEHHNAYLTGATRKPITDHRQVVSLLMSGSQTRRAITGSIVNYFLANVRMSVNGEMTDPLYRYRVSLAPQAAHLMDLLKKCVYDRVICSPKVQQERVRTQRMIIDLYDAMTYQPLRYLPERHRELFVASGEDNRVVADYIAGMTDRFLETTHQRLIG